MCITVHYVFTYLYAMLRVSVFFKKYESEGKQIE
ncbi:hypothetical protein T4C_6418 [Trichinella pseudospiralis]|uniref:Uncharacterized protein n=1 Tax=Trichinella pseudospiralis TaxID=6337 RepID=A0A0V1GFX4_TRIPS|nr:hypothetical protein T4C_6418 [Trichinella pseudospiralis]